MELKYKIFAGIIFVGFLWYTLESIRNYIKGEGLKFYISDIWDRRLLFVPHPSKLERRWLLINIVVEVLLISALIIFFV